MAGNKITISSATDAYATAIERRRAKPKRKTIGAYEGVSERALQQSNIDFGGSAPQKRAEGARKTGVAIGAAAVAGAGHKFIGKSIVYPVAKWTGRKLLGTKDSPAKVESQPAEGLAVPEKAPTIKAAAPAKKVRGRKGQRQRQALAKAKAARSEAKAARSEAKTANIQAVNKKLHTATGAEARGARANVRAATERIALATKVNSESKPTPKKRKAAATRTVDPTGTPEIKLATGAPQVEGVRPKLAARIKNKLKKGEKTATVAAEVGITQEKAAEFARKAAGDPAKIPTAGPAEVPPKGSSAGTSKRDPVKPRAASVKTSGPPGIAFTPDGNGGDRKVESGKKAQKRKPLTKDVLKQISLEKQVSRSVVGGLAGSKSSQVRGLGRKALKDLLATPEQVARTAAAAKEMNVHPKRVTEQVLAEFTTQEQAGAKQVRGRGEYIPAEGSEGEGGKKGAAAKRRRSIDAAIAEASGESKVGRRSSVVVNKLPGPTRGGLGPPSGFVPEKTTPSHSPAVLEDAPSTRRGRAVNVDPDAPRKHRQGKPAEPPRAAKINIERGIELSIDSKEAGVAKKAKTAMTRHARAQLSGAKVGAEISAGKGVDVQAALEESYQGAGRKAADARRSKEAMAKFEAEGGKVKPWVTPETVTAAPKTKTAKYTQRRLDIILADQKVGPPEAVVAHKTAVETADVEYKQAKNVAKRGVKAKRLSVGEARADVVKAQGVRRSSIGSATAKLEGVKAGAVDAAVAQASTTRGRLEVSRTVQPRPIEVQIGREASGQIIARAVSTTQVGKSPEGMQVGVPEVSEASVRRQGRRQAVKQAKIGEALRKKGETIETVRVRPSVEGATAQPKPSTIAYGASSKKMSGENRPRGELVSQSPNQRTTPEVLAHAEAEAQRRTVMRDARTSKAVHQAANLPEAMEAYRTGRPPSSRPSLAQKAAAAQAQPAMSVEAPPTRQAAIEAELAEVKAELSAREAGVKSGRPSIKFAKGLAKGAVKGAAIGTAIFALPQAAEAAVTTEGGLEERAAAVAPIVGETAKDVGMFMGGVAGVKAGAAGVRRFLPQTAARIAGSAVGRGGAKFAASRALGVAMGPVGWGAMLGPAAVQSGQAIMQHFGYRGPTVKFEGPLGIVPTGIEKGGTGKAGVVVDTVRDPHSGARRPRRSLRLR